MLQVAAPHTFAVRRVVAAVIPGSIPLWGLAAALRSNSLPVAILLIYGVAAIVGWAATWAGRAFTKDIHERYVLARRLLAPASFTRERRNCFRQRPLWRAYAIASIECAAIASLLGVAVLLVTTIAMLTKGPGGLTGLEQFALVFGPLGLLALGIQTIATEITNRKVALYPALGSAIDGVPRPAPVSADREPSERSATRKTATNAQPPRTGTAPGLRARCARVGAALARFAAVTANGGSVYVATTALVVPAAILAAPWIMTPDVVDRFLSQAADGLGVTIETLNAVLLALALACPPLVLLSGLMAARFVLRVRPPRLDGSRRWGLITLLILPGLPGLLILPLAVWLGPIILLTLALDEQFSWLEVTLIALFGGTSFAAIACYIGGFYTPLAVRYLLPRAFLTKPYTLFLRRFSTFADRAVQPALLRLAPPGKRLAALVPPTTHARDWNPYDLTMAGNKLRAPWSSVPVTLSSDSDIWQIAADELIARADSIVMDISDSAGSIELEVRYLCRGGRAPDVILLVEANPSNPVDPAVIEPLIAGGATRLEYERSWSRAVPRLVVGAVITAATIVYSSVTPFLPDLLTPLRLLAGYGHFDSWTAISILAGLAIYATWFVRPSLDHATERRLRSELRRPRRSPPPAPPEDPATATA